MKERAERKPKKKPSNPNKIWLSGVPSTLLLPFPIFIVHPFRFTLFTKPLPKPLKTTASSPLPHTVQTSDTSGTYFPQLLDDFSATLWAQGMWATRTTRVLAEGRGRAQSGNMKGNLELDNMATAIMHKQVAPFFSPPLFTKPSSHPSSSSHSRSLANQPCTRSVATNEHTHIYTHTHAHTRSLQQSLGRSAAAALHLCFQLPTTTATNSITAGQRSRGVWSRLELGGRQLHSLSGSRCATWELQGNLEE